MKNNTISIWPSTASRLHELHELTGESKVSLLDKIVKESLTSVRGCKIRNTYDNIFIGILSETPGGVSRMYVINEYMRITGRTRGNAYTRLAESVKRGVVVVDKFKNVRLADNEVT